MDQATVNTLVWIISISYSVALSMAALTLNRFYRALYLPRSSPPIEGFIVVGLSLVWWISVPLVFFYAFLRHAIQMETRRREND